MEEPWSMLASQSGGIGEVKNTERHSLKNEWV